jgi:hypothetical protein
VSERKEPILEGTVSSASEQSPFSLALDLPLSALAYPDASGIIEERIQFFGKLTKSKSFNFVALRAIELTRISHQLCDKISVQSTQLSPLFANFNSAHFMAHAIKLAETRDKETQHVHPALLLETNNTRQRVRELLLQASLDGKPIGATELIDANFADASDFQKVIAKAEASLLAAQQTSLESSAWSLQALQLLSMIWRGVFYAAVIQARGSELQNQLVMEKTAEAFPKLIKQLFALLPEVGHLFAAYDIFETLRELYHARRKVDEHFNGLMDTIISVEDYVTRYAEALVFWNRTATSLVSQVKGAFEFYAGLALGTDTNVLRNSSSARRRRKTRNFMVMGKRKNLVSTRGFD